MPEVTDSYRPQNRLDESFPSHRMSIGVCMSIPMSTQMSMAHGDDETDDGVVPPGLGRHNTAPSSDRLEAIVGR